MREPRSRRRRPRGGHICSEELCERVLDNNQKITISFSSSSVLLLLSIIVLPIERKAWHRWRRALRLQSTARPFGETLFEGNSILDYISFPKRIRACPRNRTRRSKSTLSKRSVSRRDFHPPYEMQF